MFHAGGLWREVEPDVLHQDGAAFPGLLVVEFAAVAGELAYNGRKVERAFVQVYQVNAPLVRVRVIEAKGLGFDAELVIGGRNIELFEIRIAIEKFLVVRDAVVLDPHVGALQAFGQAANVGLPVSDEKIEVVRSIALRSGCCAARGLRIRSARKPQERCWPRARQTALRAGRMRVVCVACLPCSHGPAGGATVRGAWTAGRRLLQR